MKVPYNTQYQQQNKKLIQASIKKAVITSVNIAARQVDLYFITNPGIVSKGVPVSSGVNLSTIAAGTRCKVDIFDETNPKDMVVAYTY